MAVGAVANDFGVNGVKNGLCRPVLRIIAVNKVRNGLWALRGAMVSTSAFLACHQCKGRRVVQWLARQLS